MKFPGEQLIDKLWETLVSRGIGGLLEPWQIRRRGHAEQDVKTREILAFAEAEKLAEKIRAGEISVDASKSKLLLTHSAPPVSAELVVEGASTKSDVVVVAGTGLLSDAIQEQVNIAKAITHAESALESDPSPVPDASVDADWMYRWRKSAGAVTSEAIQQLWGRVLAGELKEPGRYSLRTLDFIRNLGSADAKYIESVLSFSVGKFIWKWTDDEFERRQISFGTFLLMQELGVLIGTEAVGLTYELKSSATDKFIGFLPSNGRGLKLTHDDPKKTFELPVYGITAVGRDLLSLGSFSPNEDYLVALGQLLKGNGFSVQICDYKDAGSKLKLSNLVGL